VSQIPQRNFPRIVDYHKERLRLVYTYAQYDRELLEQDIDIGESAYQVFSGGNTSPQRRVAYMSHDRKSDSIFFRFVLRSVSETKVKVFPKRKSIFLKRKMFLFRKHLRNESVFETKVKLFLFLKRKDFNLQTKVKVFPKQK